MEFYCLLHVFNLLNCKSSLATKERQDISIVINKSVNTLFDVLLRCRQLKTQWFSDPNGQSPA